MYRLLLLIMTSVFMSGTPRPIPRPMKVGIVTFGDFRKDFIDSLKVRADRMYGARIKLIKNLEFKGVPKEYGFNVAAFYEPVIVNIPKRFKKKIGITHDALFINDQTFYYEWFHIPVLGCTNLSSTACVVTDCHAEENTALSRDELINVVLHEMGHMYELEHCGDTTCLMTPAGHLENDKLCKVCDSTLIHSKYYYKHLTVR